MPVRDLGEEVGGGGRHDDRIGAAREVDVAHAVGCAGAHRSVNTGFPDSACIVIGVMNWHAPAVITTSTVMPP